MRLLLRFNILFLDEECSASNPCTGGKICINVMDRFTCSCPANLTENAGTCCRMYFFRKSQKERVPQSYLNLKYALFYFLLASASALSD